MVERSLFASRLPGVTPEQQDFAALLASPQLGFHAPGSRSLLLFPHTILHTNSPFFGARWVDSGSKALQYNVGIYVVLMLKSWYWPQILFIYLYHTHPT